MYYVMVGFLYNCFVNRFCLFNNYYVYSYRERERDIVNVFFFWQYIVYKIKWRLWNFIYGFEQIEIILFGNILEYVQILYY